MTFAGQRNDHRPVQPYTEADIAAAVLVLGAGMRWLTKVEQHERAVVQHHGAYGGTARLRIQVCPRGSGGLPVIVCEPVDAEKYPDDAPVHGVFDDDHIAALRAAITTAGFTIDHEWNGAGCATSSFASTRLDLVPSLDAALRRYHDGCTLHPRERVFCKCDDWRGRFALNVTSLAAVMAS